MKYYDIIAIKFTAKAGEQFDMNVFDITGRMIMSEKLLSSDGENNHELDLSGVAKGIYTVQLQSPGSVISMRIGG